MLHLDDHRRIDGLVALLEAEDPQDPGTLDEPARRLFRALTGSLLGKNVPRETTLAEGAALLWRHPQVRAELLELLEALRDRVDRPHPPLTTHPNSPLNVHARYTRVEIQAALGISGDGARGSGLAARGPLGRRDPYGHLGLHPRQVLGGFSPTTRYRDYAISQNLIHWESQNAVRADSPTGLRYQQHVRIGTTVLLFAREDSATKAFWFLGPAKYVRHTSERPMEIVWRLEHPLPGDLLAAFAAAVA